MDSPTRFLLLSFSWLYVTAPHLTLKAKENEDVEHVLDREMQHGEFISEGFCFKMAPGHEVRLTKFW